MIWLICVAYVLAGSFVVGLYSDNISTIRQEAGVLLFWPLAVMFVCGCLAASWWRARK